MNELVWVAFITGLTTGGISCMAVQGGLLTSSLASQIETSLAGARKSVKKGPIVPANSPRLALPILLFVLAKLAAYTLLGFALGALGSVLDLNATARGILQIAVAIFMIGNALRMLNVHPIFRFFNFEPPAPVRRYLRQKSKNSDAFFTPLFLGALTVLIPCGVTQSMMAVAVGTASPMLGAVIMFSFILGTSPVFFGLVYLATKLSSLMEKWFVRIVVAALFILGLISLDSGLSLLDSPFTLRMIPAAAVGVFSPDRPAAVSNGEVTLNVTNGGYFPALISAPANQTLKLKLVSKNTSSCARAFLIPSLNISTLMPATGEQSFDIPPQKPGTRIGFTCSMGMYTGEIIFD